MILSEEEKENRQEYADRLKIRINSLSLKQVFIAELIGIKAGHLYQIIMGYRPVHRYKDKIEIILEELEQAEQNIKQRLEL